MSSHSKKLTLGIELIDDPAWMGGTLYLRNLVICLSRLPEHEQPKIQLLGATDIVVNFLNAWGHLPIFSSASGSLLGRLSRRLGLSTKAVTSVDVIYPGFGAQIPGAVTARWIPDFQHRYLPKLFSIEEIAARDQSIADIAARSGVVVFSSETAADDFRQFYPDHKAMPCVWHFCSLLDTSKPASHTTIEKYGLPEKYLYLPNQFWAHKNHITVLRALARLRRERSMVIPLVCTGEQSDRRNEAHFSGLQRYIEDQGLTEQVKLLGLIARDEQIDVLRCAAAVVQPSLFEGWSTVVEDVRATGRPIFLSDIPVHKEQSPPNCNYFNAKSDEDLALLLAEKWNRLQPGPEVHCEEKARQEVELRILNSARVFCDIAHLAVNTFKAR